MSKINRSKFSVLGVLTFGPSSGYDIKKIMKRSTEHFWRESDASIYPMLRELEQEGLVVGDVDRSSGERIRKVYTITEEGKTEFLEWLTLYPEPEIVRHELLLKFFFAHNLPKNRVIEFLKRYRQDLCEGKEELDSIGQKFKDSEKGKNPYGLMTLRYGQLYTEAAIKWCEEVLETLEKSQKS